MYYDYGSALTTAAWIEPQEIITAAIGPYILMSQGEARPGLEQQQCWMPCRSLPWPRRDALPSGPQYLRI